MRIDLLVSAAALALSAFSYVACAVLAAGRWWASPSTALGTTFSLSTVDGTPDSGRGQVEAS